MKLTQKHNKKKSIKIIQISLKQQQKNRKLKTKHVKRKQEIMKLLLPFQNILLSTSTILWIAASTTSSNIFVSADTQCDLSEAMERWQQFDTNKYYFQLETENLPTEGNGIGLSVQTTLGIHVQDNMVIDIHNTLLPLNTGILEGPAIIAPMVPTIDNLFIWIQRALNAPKEQQTTISVNYDPTYGYPSSFAIIYNDNQQQDTPSPPGIINPQHFVGMIKFFLPTSMKIQELGKAKTHWDTFGYSGYDLIFQRNQLLLPPLSDQVKVEVRDGQLSNVTTTNEGTDVTDIFSMCNPPTIPNLFNEILADLELRNPIDIDISYNRVYGYPERSYILFHRGSINGGGGTTPTPPNSDPERGGDVIAERVDGPSDDFHRFDVMSFSPLHRDDFESAKALWDSQGLSNYGIGWHKYCQQACTTPGSDSPLWVEVENDNVVANVTYRFETDSDPPLGGIIGSVETIDDIFALIETAIDRNFDQLAVIYNDDYGYPEYLYIDRDVQSGTFDVKLYMDSLAPRTHWQESLDHARAIWDTANVQTYGFEYIHHTIGLFGSMKRIINVRKSAVHYSLCELSLQYPFHSE